MKKILIIFLLMTLLISCATGESGEAKSTTAVEVTEETTTAVTEGPGTYKHNLNLDYDGTEFTIYGFENINVHSESISKEETGDTLNDALYNRTMLIEEAFNITITEVLSGENENAVKNSILAGDDTYDLATVRCTAALTFYKENLIIPFSDIDTIDLTRPYWEAATNESLTIGNVAYIAVGSYNIPNYDLAYALLFNKTMMEANSLGNLYSTVSDGKWTIDAMSGLMKQAVRDLNGDGTMTIDDQWGYTSHPKQVLSNFWIAAGEKSIKKDADDMPYIAMKEERFVSVIEKAFAATRDDDKSFIIEGSDVPDEAIKLFSEGRSLFMDISFFYIERMRSSDAEFGIIPYPKYDEVQENYYSRISYYIPTVIPSSVSDAEMSGAILEALNCESANIVLPKYFDIMLKTKYSRDEESAAMLDLIFARRIIDIGDTTLCDMIRDGFIVNMYKADDRDLTSKVEANENRINDRLNIFK